MEDDPATHTYFILAGRVKLSEVTPEGQRRRWATLAPGAKFAELLPCWKTWSTRSRPRLPATAGWKQEAACSLDGGDPTHRLQRDVDHGALRLSTSRAATASWLPQRGGLAWARTLLRLAQQSGRKVANGVLIDLASTCRIWQRCPARPCSS